MLGDINEWPATTLDWKGFGKAIDDNAMPKKKKYNVNGDSGIKAQVRAAFRYFTVVSLVKSSLGFLLLSSFLLTFALGTKPLHLGKRET